MLILAVCVSVLLGLLWSGVRSCERDQASWHASRGLPFVEHPAVRPEDGNAVAVTLLYGGFPELPAAAEAVCVATEGNMFTRTFWLTFRLEPGEMNAFLDSNTVTGLDVVSPREEEWVGMRARHCIPDQSAFDEVYEIPSHGNAYHGWLLLDRVEGWVYLVSSRS